MSISHTRPTEARFDFNCQALLEGVQIDISNLEEHLAREDYGSIIKDPELFLLAFLKALSSVRNKNLITSVEGNRLTISGDVNCYPQIKKNVEEIRQCFLDGYEKEEDFMILPVKDGYGYQYYLKPKSPIVTIGEGDVFIPSLWFDSIIKPCMPILSESLGAICYELEVDQTVKYLWTGEQKEEKINAFKIDRISQKNLVYPISPIQIPTRDNFNTFLHSLYQKQELCDLTLVTKDGDIHMHLLPLFAYGGEMFQKMLTTPMKESQEKVINFELFSKETVEAFVDFIYLGQGGLEAGSFLQKRPDFYELLRMAHTYQVTPLIDHCTNLISLVAFQEDPQNIKDLAEYYNNDHLRRLYEHLSDPNDVHLMKV